MKPCDVCATIVWLSLEPVISDICVALPYFWDGSRWWATPSAQAAHLCCLCIDCYLSISAVAASPDPRTCAIYYFLAAVFVLLVAFDTFFALPMLVSSILLLWYPPLCITLPQLWIQSTVLVYCIRLFVLQHYHCSSCSYRQWLCIKVAEFIVNILSSPVMPIILVFVTKYRYKIPTGALIVSWVRKLTFLAIKSLYLRNSVSKSYNSFC